MQAANVLLPEAHFSVGQAATAPSIWSNDEGECVDNGALTAVA